MHAISNRVSEMPPPHDAARIFPMMSDEELKGLAEDIRQHGLRDSITMLDGKILDGRNRWAACIIAGIEPRTEEWKGSGDPIDWVHSENFHRRHLNAAQRATVAVNRLAYYEAQAKERQAEGGKAAGRGRQKVTDDLTVPYSRDDRTAVAQAAKAVGAGVSATKALKAVKEKAPDVFDLAAEGKVKVAEAKRLAEMPEAARQSAVELISIGAKPVKTKKPKADRPATIVGRWRDQTRTKSPAEKKELLHFLKNWVAALEKEISA